MSLLERNTMNWIDDSKNRQSNQTSDSNMLSRILRAAVASFGDLFEDERMSKLD